MTNKAAVAVLVAALAVPFEGLRRTWYFDPPGIPTVCYGHTGLDVDKSKVYTMNECKALLTKDVLYAVSAVDKCRPGLPPKVLAAFADLTYNAGPTAACDTAKSTAARKLAAGDFAGACNELPKWDKARVAGIMVALPGLTRRRLAERDLCLS